MKLASLNYGRDGQLLVVSRDLKTCVNVSKTWPTLQYALDNWVQAEPALLEIYETLNAGLETKAVAFDTRQLMSPLPRAYQWADGSAYVKHVELVRKARGATLPENFWTDPLMYQGGPDFIGPTHDILVEDEAYGIDFEAEVAVITGDVPMAATSAQTHDTIRLLMLVNDVSLRNLIPNEIAKGFGFFQSKPPTAFSPVAVTPDELGDAWDGAKLHLPLQTYLNGKLFGEPNAGIDMTFDFPTLIAHAAKTRPLMAGSVIGSGTVSNLDNNTGSSCIAERRMLEVLESGSAVTPFMKFGDSVRIEMKDLNGQSIFGAIDQEVAAYEAVHLID